MSEAKVPEADRVFGGSIPELYERYLVPLIFQSYASDLARRVAQRQPKNVLEIAAGTGALTRQLGKVLPPSTAIVATDLNLPMLDQARAAVMPLPVEWRQADAMQLPFADETFDVVVCQFAVMFFSDKVRAFSEARRVLRRGGSFLFNAWDRIEQNEFAEVVTQVMAVAFPDDPPRFLARIPHGYHECSAIAEDLATAGFGCAPEFTTLSARSRADSPRIPALAYCQGTPLRSEIEARDGSRLAAVTELATAAIANRFGCGTVDGKIQAHIVTIPG